MFNQRHYKAIAEVMKRNKPLDNWSANKHVQWGAIYRDLRDMFAADSPKFKDVLFAEACGDPQERLSQV